MTAAVEASTSAPVSRNRRGAGRGAGNNGPVSTAKASSFLNTAGKVGRVTISERIEAGRRERRVLTRVSRAAWRLEQAERERTWALVSARAEGIWGGQVSPKGAIWHLGARFLQIRVAALAD